MPVDPRLRRRRCSLALLALVAALAIGCTKVPEADRIAESLEATGVSPEVAECAARAFLDNLPEKDVKRIVERGAEGVIDHNSSNMPSTTLAPGETASDESPAYDNEPIDIARREIAACRDLEPAVETPPTYHEAPSTTEVTTDDPSITTATTEVTTTGDAEAGATGDGAAFDTVPLEDTSDAPITTTPTAG